MSVIPHPLDQIYLPALLMLKSWLARRQTGQPRKKGELGSPVSKPVPPYAKNWMLKPDIRKIDISCTEVETDTEYDIIINDDDDVNSSTDESHI